MIDPTAFIDEYARVEPDATIGANSRVWGFTHILGGSRIGTECNICEQVFIEGDVIVGDRVTVKSGVQLWDGVRLEDDVFIGPNVTFTNDKYPRSQQYPERFLGVCVKARASIGGGGSDPARAYDRRGRGGWRRCSGHSLRTERCDGGWQSSSHSATDGSR